MIKSKQIFCDRNTLNYLTVYKQRRSDLFKKVTNKPFVYKSYIQYIYKEDLVLNNKQGVIYHKTLPTNKTKRRKALNLNQFYTA